MRQNLINDSETVRDFIQTGGEYIEADGHQSELSYFCLRLRRWRYVTHDWPIERIVRALPPNCPVGRGTNNQAAIGNLLGLSDRCNNRRKYVKVGGRIKLVKTRGKIL